MHGSANHQNHLREAQLPIGFHNPYKGKSPISYNKKYSFSSYRKIVRLAVGALLLTIVLYLRFSTSVLESLSDYIPRGIYNPSDRFWKETSTDNGIVKTTSGSSLPLLSATISIPSVIRKYFTAAATPIAAAPLASDSGLEWDERSGHTWIILQDGAYDPKLTPIMNRIIARKPNLTLASAIDGKPRGLQPIENEDTRNSPASTNDETVDEANDGVTEKELRTGEVLRQEYFALPTDAEKIEFWYSLTQSEKQRLYTNLNEAEQKALLQLIFFDLLQPNKWQTLLQESQEKTTVDELDETSEEASEGTQDGAEVECDLKCFLQEDQDAFLLIWIQFQEEELQETVPSSVVTMFRESEEYLLFVKTLGGAKPILDLESIQDEELEDSIVGEDDEKESQRGSDYERSHGYDTSTRPSKSVTSDSPINEDEDRPDSEPKDIGSGLQPPSTPNRGTDRSRQRTTRSPRNSNRRPTEEPSSSYTPSYPIRDQPPRSHLPSQPPRHSTDNTEPRRSRPRSRSRRRPARSNSPSRTNTPSRSSSPSPSHWGYSKDRDDGRNSDPRRPPRRPSRNHHPTSRPRPSPHPSQRPFGPPVRPPQPQPHRPPNYGPPHDSTGPKPEPALDFVGGSDAEQWHLYWLGRSEEEFKHRKPMYLPPGSTLINRNGFILVESIRQYDTETTRRQGGADYYGSVSEDYLHTVDSGYDYYDEEFYYYYFRYYEDGVDGHGIPTVRLTVLPLKEYRIFANEETGEVEPPPGPVSHKEKTESGLPKNAHKSLDEITIVFVIVGILAVLAIGALIT